MSAEEDTVGPKAPASAGAASNGADGAPEPCAPAAAAPETTTAVRDAAQADDPSPEPAQPAPKPLKADDPSPEPAQPVPKPEKADDLSPEPAQPAPKPLKVDDPSPEPAQPVPKPEKVDDPSPEPAQPAPKPEKADDPSPEPAQPAPKRLKVSDLLGSFERTLKETAPPPLPRSLALEASLLAPALDAEVSAPAVAEEAKPRKFDDGKRILVVRHGEGCHQLKGYTPKEGDLLGPELTNKGKEQAHAAQKMIALELEKLGFQEASLDALVVSSNLLRAVHTALLLMKEGCKSKVLVHPALRERILDSRDEPSELNHLREWLMDREYDEQVDLTLYEEALIEAGSKATDFASMELHEIYLRSCRASDLKGDTWNAKQNKEMLQERAATFTHWLEEHSCQVAILVGHACFLGMLTGDKEWLENGEVRSYSLQQGYYTRLSKASSKVPRLPRPAGPAAPSVAPNIGGVSGLIPSPGVGRGIPFPRWSGVRAPAMRPRGSLAIPRPSR